MWLFQAARSSEENDLHTINQSGRWVGAWAVRSELHSEESLLFSWWMTGKHRAADRILYIWYFTKEMGNVFLIPPPILHTLPFTGSARRLLQPTPAPKTWIHIWDYIPSLLFLQSTTRWDWLSWNKQKALIVSWSTDVLNRILFNLIVLFVL